MSVRRDEAAKRMPVPSPISLDIRANVVHLDVDRLAETLDAYNRETYGTLRTVPRIR